MSGATSTSGSKPIAVIPRAHRKDSEASLPIDQLVLPAARNATAGIILITADPGGGKTTALDYLRATLPPDLQVEFFDADQDARRHRAGVTGLVVWAALHGIFTGDSVDVFELSRWTLDDCVEYLVSTHRDQCASVMARLTQDASIDVTEGSPQLLSLVMGAMAKNFSLKNAREILRDQIRRVMPLGQELDQLMIKGTSRVSLTSEQWHWWRHGAIRRIATADWIVSRLAENEIPRHLESIDDNARLIDDIAVTLRDHPSAHQFLQFALETAISPPSTPMMASILLAADPDWRPADGSRLDFRKARLARARWAGIDLSGSQLFEANFAGADLSGANLRGVNASQAHFRGAILRGAHLENARFVDVNLISADLSQAIATSADFSRADLHDAILREGQFVSTQWDQANLQGINAESADFSNAHFSAVDLRDASFASANFTGATLKRLDMSNATWLGARFPKAVLHACNLEGLRLPNANFYAADLTGSLLTGSAIPGGQFLNAKLCKTGLAEIDWQDADLRNADFTDASFHLGSTRSGLVGSSIPSEGSRTGFYTDDYNDQTYKAPEEIRKANLCGSNFLGANVEKTDFYLVDLRRAIYSKAQARHFSQSGAILRSVNA